MEPSVYQGQTTIQSVRTIFHAVRIRNNASKGRFIYSGDVLHNSSCRQSMNSGSGEAEVGGGGFGASFTAGLRAFMVLVFRGWSATDGGFFLQRYVHRIAPMLEE